MTNLSQNIDSGTGAQIGHADIVNLVAENKATGIPKNLTLLPTRNPNFVGRKLELEKISSSFLEDSLVYIVNGIGGIGKSELAYQYIHENKEKYQHIALFKFSKESKSLEGVLVNNLRHSLVLDDAANLEQILYRLQNLQGKSLLVFDNLKSKSDIEALKPLNSCCDVLITTRLVITDQGHINLDILDIDDARTLFKNHYDTKEIVDDILKFIDYHSLFIELIAKTLHEGCISISELRDRFSKGEFTKIDRNCESSFNDLLVERFEMESNNELKDLLQRLSILPSIEIEIKTLEEIFLGDSRLRPKLSELAKRGWLIQKGDTYKLHQIIKEFVLNNHSIDFFGFENNIDNITNLLETENPYFDPVDKIAYIEIIDSILDRYIQEKNSLVASLLNCLSFLHLSLARYQLASKLAKNSLEIRVTLFGVKHPSVAKAYRSLTTCYIYQGRYKEAFDVSQKSLDICKDILGDNHYDTAISFQCMATVYRSQDRYNNAIQCLLSASSILDKNTKKINLVKSYLYAELGTNYQYQEKSLESLELFYKALEIQEEIFGSNSTNLATLYNNIAISYEVLGNYSKALDLYEKSLSIHEKVLGKKHPHTASVYNNIAALYFAQKNYTEALPLFKKSLYIILDVFGENHPLVAISYTNIADLYKNIGYYEDSSKSYLKAISIREKTLGKDNFKISQSYMNLARLYDEEKKCNQALAYATKALEINQETDIVELQSLIKSLKWRIKKSKKLPINRKIKICID
jgi:tetratricopeptide (TPR) repeat protein